MSIDYNITIEKREYDHVLSKDLLVVEQGNYAIDDIVSIYERGTDRLSVAVLDHIKDSGRPGCLDIQIYKWYSMDKDNKIVHHLYLESDRFQNAVKNNSAEGLSFITDFRVGDSIEIINNDARYEKRYFKVTGVGRNAEDRTRRDITFGF